MRTETVQPIAVIGMACRYPGAGNLLQLWENILSRRQQFREIPDVRLPLADYYDPDPAAPDKTYGRKAAVLDGFEFDPGTYRIPKSTFEATDIVHWLSLATALEALNHARVRPDALPKDTAGAIIGNTLTGEETRAGTMRLRWPFVRKVLRKTAQARGLSEDLMQEFETAMEDVYKSVFPAASEDTLAGGLANTIAGRICNYLDWHGGGYIVDGACSSSLLAVATAADYLQQGKMDLAIAGGVDVSLDTLELIGFAKATALTRDEMRVYDRRGKGFIPGEGCGMVVLKRLEDARRDGDTVYAVLRGWGVSSDGRGGITAPSAKGQSLALLRAYRAAGYAPQTLAFVEGHGTGTAVGDRTELEGVAGALAAYGAVEDHSVGMTSFKSIVGHTKAAAGIGGFIKAVLAVNRRVVPPTAGCTEPHPSFAESARGLYPVLDGQLREPNECLRAGVSAMGFGGINCHVTLESGDPPSPELEPSLPERVLLASRQHTEVFPFSAADPHSLRRAVCEFRRQIEGMAVGELVDAAARAATLAGDHPWRAAVVAGSVEELESRLELLERQLEQETPTVSSLWQGDQVWIGHAISPQRVGFLFPGQGSQQTGMGRSLVERFEWARDTVTRSDAEAAALRPEDPDGRLSRLYLRSTERDPAKKLEPAWMAALTATENAQPAICTASLLWQQRLESLGILPSVVGGHSLGELTALAAAGAYDASTLIRLATLRGLVMAAPEGEAGAMGVLACDAATTEAILAREDHGYCAIANINSPSQTVISGERAAVARAVELANADGIRASLLPVSNAFHSRLVESAAEDFRRNADVPERAGELIVRVFSSIDGSEIASGVDLRAHLSRQIVSPVNFTRLLEAMSEHCDWLVEVGPGRVLSGLAQSHGNGRVRPCLPVEGRPGRDADFNAVVAEAHVRGLALRWERLYENRLVRPFVPASARKFYVAPCERELGAVPQVDGNRPVLRDGALRRIGERTASDLAQLSETLTAAFRDAVHADHATVLLFEQSEQSLRVVLPFDMFANRLSAADGIFADVLRSGAPEAIEILGEDPRVQAELETLGVPPSWTALYVPFPSGAGHPLGLVRVARRPGEPFTPMDAEILAELAAIAAPGLIQAYLAERARELDGIETMLHRVVARETVDPRPEAIIGNLVESAKDSLGAEYGALLLHDRDTAMLYPAFGAAAEKQGLSAERGIPGEVFTTRRSLHLANAHADPRFEPTLDRLAGVRTRAVDCVPVLTMQHLPLGVLLLINRRFPGNRDYLTELGLRIGALLANRPLLDRMRSISQNLKGEFFADVRPAIIEHRPEPAAAAPASAGTTAASARDVVLALLAERTGFAIDTLKDEARLIDDLNLDSIKIGTLLGDAAIRLGVQGTIDPMHLHADTVGSVIAAFDAVAPTPPVTSLPPVPAMDLVLDLVAERTGFSRDCLAPDQRLLDDLNIDSIKAGALLGDLILATGTQDRVDAAPLANATLEEIAAALQTATGGEAARSKPAAAIAKAPARRLHWVRAFRQSRVAAPLVSPCDAPEPPAGECLVVLPLAGAPFAEHLGRRLAARTVNAGDLERAQLPEDTQRLVIVLSDDDAPRAGSVADAGVDELAVVHRLARQTPALWRNLNGIFFLQRSGQRGLPGGRTVSAWSFAASLSLERPELEVGVIDFDPALTADFVADRVAAELSGQPGYKAVEYDGEGKRWSRCIERIEPEDCTPRSIEWSAEDVVLVTGGGKGITAECALAFALETGVRLALIGRSPAPQPGESGELAATLRRFAEAGVDCRYYAADVADLQAMERAITTIHSEMGPVTGVIHGAGTNTPRPVTEVSAEQARREIAPKLKGAENLLALFGNRPPKLFAALTSIIGVTGMMNNAWYAYSNEAVARLLDGFAQAHPETAVVCHAFSVWDEVGMGVKLGSVRHLGQLGIDAIPVAEGVRQFLRWMRTAPPTREVIVAASADGLATWVRPPVTEVSPPAGRFLGEVQRFEPGIELITQVSLDTRHDLYLTDHDYRGSLLLPTIMGLEAMAQAALRVAGEAGAEVVRIEDIRLERPIVVNPERPQRIEIRALALERTAVSEPIVVEASVHAEQTGMEPAHFAARFVLGRRRDAEAGETALPPRQLLGIVPKVDLYGSVLFQGPLFQRISGVESLDDNHVVFVTEARAETVHAPEGFSDTVRAPLVLGDPFYRDTLLQAGQLTLTPDVCLPVHIGRIDLYRQINDGGVYRARAEITQRNGHRVLADVVVYDDNDRIVERIENYEVHMLEHGADLPTPAQLVEQADSTDEPSLQETADRQAGKFGLSAPYVIIRKIPELHKRKRHERRALSLPVFHAAVRGAGRRFAVDTSHLEIRWLENGKPILFRPPVPPKSGTTAGLGETMATHTPLEVSLSHDDEMLLCVAGKGFQGCDLVGPIQRSREQWRAMLNANLFSLVHRLESRGELLNEAGARVWAALEAAMKALNTRDLTLDIEAMKADGVLFRATDKYVRLWIVSFPLVREHGGQRMVAMVVTGTPVLDKAVPVKMAHPAPTGENDGSWLRWLAAGGDPADILRVETHVTAQDSDHRIAFRFPLAFKDGANADGTLYFSRYFEWMGRIREMALRPVLRQLTSEFTSGEHAWVTNRSWAVIEKPVCAGEIIEVSCRFLGRNGPGNATVAVGFEWNRVPPHGTPERVATSQIQMTWAKVLSHGVVIPEPYPPYLDSFFRELEAAPAEHGAREQTSHNRSMELLGTALWRAKPGPAGGVFLAEQSVVTSPNDANLVGNIYYSKYYELQGSLRDSYFHGIVPDAYRIGEAQEGLRCIFTEIRHLRDAMPFDTIKARMSVAAIHQKGVLLAFDFFRLLPGGKSEKLATGTHVAAWRMATESAEITNLPSMLRIHLLKMVRDEILTAPSKSAA
ncbi:type I polyketide synthase [Methylococcus capsulatus]|uniref:type I polyketide synthase n=1 Tax=Methylococcus capsulatus TaxID=414 RepID=UPI001C53258A|nr:type I polyketide synthase [Methylococcus capsulatus]QXP88039.1 SDR family NAD(P)-dependent oxidoreductase [Methylococcus capsulatus]UQN13067.1 SDR family NAD(P)-dependent oxidoreductase [Methylococcus capsulatus]